LPIKFEVQSWPEIGVYISGVWGPLWESFCLR